MNSTCQPGCNSIQCNDTSFMYPQNSRSFWGGKEARMAFCSSRVQRKFWQFYSLPCGQAVASMYYSKIILASTKKFWWAGLLQFFGYFNSPKFHFLIGQVKNTIHLHDRKSTSPRLSDTIVSLHTYKPWKILSLCWQLCPDQQHLYILYYKIIFSTVFVFAYQQSLDEHDHMMFVLHHLNDILELLMEPGNCIPLWA